MSRQAIALFVTTVLIWGSTWYAIKFQLGVVDPIVSVGWRFLAAAGLMFLLCRAWGISVAMTTAQHRWAVVQGVSLFGLNYVLFYIATGYITTGLIAVIFSTMVIWNAFGAKFFLGSTVPIRVVIGGAVGTCGLLLLFLPDLFNMTYGPAELGALLLCMLATMCASSGNLVNARNQKAGMGLMVGNAWGMLYGSVLTLLAALVLGRPLAFDFSTAYVLSFLYLVVFGSIVAFGCYMTIIRNAGPEKAAFATLCFPVVALAISTVAEGYQWTLEAVLGVGLVVYGNYVALRRV